MLSSFVIQHVRYDFYMSSDQQGSTLAANSRVWVGRGDAERGMCPFVGLSSSTADAVVWPSSLAMLRGFADRLGETKG